ncbi:MAG: hypothetical protein ACPGVU_08895 [Limisphaerales bacterium]
MAPEICPNCGALIEDERALACPQCGADESTGWGDDATAQRLGVPDADFDYDEYVESEFSTEKRNPVKTKGISWWAWALTLLIVFLLIRNYL